MVIEKFQANFLWFAYPRKKKKFCRKENLLIRSPNHFHYHFFPCHYQWYLNMKKNHTFFLSLTLSKNAKYDLRKKNIKIIFLYIYTTHLTFFQNSSFFKKRIWFSIFNINMQVGKKGQSGFGNEKEKNIFFFIFHPLNIYVFTFSIWCNNIDLAVKRKKLFF